MQGVVSFPMDIEPIFQRAANYYWINKAGEDFWQAMRTFLENPEMLKDNREENKENREMVLETISKSRGSTDFRMTKRQKALLDRWASGDFIAGPDPARPTMSAGQLLDQAALSRAVGGGFYPGIEAGLLLREPTIYSERCRLTRSTFTDFGGASGKLAPGSLSRADGMSVASGLHAVPCRLVAGAAAGYRST